MNTIFSSSCRAAGFLTIIFFSIIVSFIIYIGTRNWDKTGTYNTHLKNKTLMACDMPVQNDTIIKVKHLKAYVVGSYIEHRQRPKLIRAITNTGCSSKRLHGQSDPCCIYSPSTSIGNLLKRKTNY